MGSGFARFGFFLHVPPSIRAQRGIFSSSESPLASAVLRPQMTPLSKLMDIVFFGGIVPLALVFVHYVCAAFALVQIVG